MSSPARGRYRYYRLAGPAVGELMETLARLSPAAPAALTAGGHPGARRARARSCYDHLAGRLGVELTAALISRGLLTVAEPAEPDVGPGPASRPGELTAGGRARLTALGLALPGADVVRCCTDWTEQRPHPDRTAALCCPGCSSGIGCVTRREAGPSGVAEPDVRDSEASSALRSAELRGGEFPPCRAAPA